MPELQQNLAACGCGVVLWFGLSGLTRYTLARWSKTKHLWAKLNDSKRQLLVSLVNSSVHGILIPAGVAIDFTHCGIWGDFLSSSCSHVEIWFSLTATYFIVDFIILHIYPDEDLQLLYLVHHAIGVLPYLINCFHCSNLHFLVGAGIMIETANPCLNALILLELYGFENSEYAAKLQYFTLMVWIVVRVWLPLYLSHGMFTISIPTLGFDKCGVIPTYATGFIITVFCICVLLFKILPKAVWYLRGKHREQQQKEA